MISSNKMSLPTADIR